MKKILFVLVFICAKSILSFGQEDNLEVKGTIQANSVTIKGGLGDTSYPKTPVKGEVFYRGDIKQFSTYDGTQWKGTTGSATNDKYVATKVVAAYNSKGTTCSGSGPSAICTNPRADYTCNNDADQETIKEAIDSLGSTGGAVYLLEGDYKISNPILLDNGTADSINDSGKAIIGTGIGGTVLSSTIGSVISAANVNGILISNVKIGLVGGGTGIGFINVNFSKIEHVYISGGSYGIVAETNCSSNIFSGNYLANSSFANIHINSGSNNVVSDNVCSGNAEYGINIESLSPGNIIAKNSIINSDNAAIRLSGANNSIVTGNNIYKQNYIGTAGAAIWLYGAQDSVVSGNNIEQCTLGILISESGFENKNNIISGNTIKGYSLNGLLVYGGTNTLSGNLIYNSTGDTGEHGIYLTIPYEASPPERNLISCNRVHDETTGVAKPYYGIYLEKGSFNYLSGNLIDGSGFTSPILEHVYSHSYYTDNAKITLNQQELKLDLSGSCYLDLSVRPFSYVLFLPPQPPLVPVDTTLTISNGKAGGDLLILENSVLNPKVITINNSGNIKLPATGNLTLLAGQLIALIWDADAIKWHQVTKYP
jgi:hypothetical protein